MVEGVHANIGAIEKMEEACARFSRAMLERLSDVAFELRRVSDALEERSEELRREISRLEEEIESADEEDDTSWERNRLEDAREERASVQRRRRKLEEAGAAYMPLARQAEHLATAHTVKAQEFLRGAADDLRVYFKKEVSNSGPTDTHKLCLNSGRASSVAVAPVSSFLSIEVRDDALCTKVRHALAAIDEVHSAAKLPLTKIRAMPAARDGYGYFQLRRTETGTTVDHVAVNPSGPWPELNVLHEVGHLLDYAGIGREGVFATKVFDPAIQDVLNAARHTNAVRGLQSRLSTETDGEQQDRLNELLFDSEIWARAYAQFVATRSSSQVLKEQVVRASTVDKFRQWSEEDFVSINEAIEKLFVSKNWI